MNKQLNREVDETWDWMLSADLDLIDPPISIVRCHASEYRSEIGIHLLEPTQRELEDALETASRDMFTTIYCHYSNVWSIRRQK